HLSSCFNALRCRCQHRPVEFLKLKQISGQNVSSGWPVAGTEYARSLAGSSVAVGTLREVRKSMELKFLGAAQTVTGSKFLVSEKDCRVLIDCGLFQGFKHLRLKNWEQPGLDPLKLDAVVLTHAHLDHSGYLPVLYKRGFRGPVYCTPATAEL